MAEACLAEGIERIAGRVRAFLEPHWAEWHMREGNPSFRTPSQGTCGRSSLFLRDVLRSEDFAAEFVAGAPSEGAQGFWTGGHWFGHAWVLCGDWIVDVTADQFGAPPVIVTYVGDARYRAGVDTAEPQLLEQRQQIAMELMAEWKAVQAEGVDYAT